MSGVLYLCVYNNNLHSLVRNTVHCTALVLIFYIPNSLYLSKIPTFSA